MTDLTLKKSLAATVVGIAILAVGCGGGDEPALGASTSVPTSQFESAPATAAPPSVSPAPPAVVNTSPVAAQVTLDDVLAEVDQALADIDDALANTEDNR
ncbi:MAG: hypothetical protein ABI658_15770 [Acidimicrobiales bacterium]